MSNIERLGVPSGERRSRREVTTDAFIERIHQVAQDFSEFTPTRSLWRSDSQTPHAWVKLLETFDNYERTQLR